MMPSTVIAKIEYDEPSQELIITFVSGRKYVYQAVPPDIYDRFARARVKGTFFNDHIRDCYNHMQA
jgi:KTSC domain-containing protein